MEEIGLYVHIPFCKQKCYYCDFVSFSNKGQLIEKYVECLIKEIDSYNLENYNVTTIYIGGGTPSCIDSKHIKNIIAKIKEKLSTNITKFEEIEITIEINPGTINIDKLKDYKEIGINRISIGLQSTNNEILKQIGRIHNYEQFRETYDLAKQVGFENINVDLMIGLPEQRIKDLNESLIDIIKLEPNHISVYSLIVEENTKMEELIDSGERKLPDEELERQMYWYVKNTLELNGYNHYEISNFSKKGKESKHNINCWKQKQYIGFGVSAHSYLNRIRYSNIENIEKYIDNINENNMEQNKIIQEEQSLQDEMKEFMMLGFRMLDGVCISDFKEKFIENPIFVYRKELNELVEQGLIEIDINHIRLTSKGLDLANKVFEKFVD